ncbi:MAG: PAS domain S-box protein, partial [Dehalococcoidia bacterium]
MKDSEKTKEQLIDELVELHHRITELEASEAECKQAQERIEHLNLVLRAIRNVHQVIAHEKDQESLLKGICDKLTETRGYYNAWVALIDKAGRLVRTAEAGLGSDFLPMLEKLKRGELTACGQKALSYSGVVVVEDPSSTCVDCPLSAKYGGRGAMTVRLEHEGKVYGLVSLSTPRALIAEEEQTLFQEFAGDIAFALRGAELGQERKRAEEELRESEEKYRLIFECTGTDNTVISVDGVYLMMNENGARRFGGKPEDFIGKSVHDTFPKEAADEYVRRFRDVAESGETKTYEDSVQLPMGNRWFLTNMWPVEDPSGSMTSVQLISHDITDRKQAEETLRELNEKYQQIIDNTWDIIFHIDLEGNYTFANKAAERLTGYPIEELLRMNMRELIVPEYQSFVFGRLKKRIAGQPLPQPFDFEIVHKDAHRVVLELTTTGIHDKNGKLIGVQGIARNITERKRAEESLKETEERYRGLFENSTEGVLAVDLAGNYTSVNKAMEELTGYSREELIGRSYGEFVSPETAEFVFGEYNKLFRTGEPVHNIVYERVSKDGKREWLEEYATVIKKEGKVVGFQGTLRDITERRRVEQALRESEEKLRAQYKGIPVPTYTWQRIGEDLVLVDYNDAAVAITQGQIANYIGKKDSEMYQNRPEILNDLSRCFAEKTSIYREMLYEYMSTGETKHLAVSYAFVPPDLVLVHTEDITERKRLEQSLKESEERYRALFENSIEAVFTVDTAGNFTSGNKALEELTGYPLEEIVGASYTKIIVPEDVDHIFKEYNKLFRTGKPIRNLVYEMVRKDGERRLIEGYVNLITEDTRIVGFQGTLRDITERKKAEEQLERSFVDLAETVSRAIGSRDPYTAVHQRRVADLA